MNYSWRLISGWDKGWAVVRSLFKWKLQKTNKEKTTSKQSKLLKNLHS